MKQQAGAAAGYHPIILKKLIKTKKVMKKILLAASLLIAATTFAGTNNVTAVKFSSETGKGKHIPASQVPASIIATFNAQFPTATNVRWQLEREHGQSVYQAQFLLNGKSMKVQYPG